ncbi:hypothetical protein [Corynebacterium guangdongense]|uniref:Secreted protein n=1 Tax=Corynebacterium guangdongense TaxID=1783348 RepID=A0ABU1ZYQ2_9CORY|nr:hypothetical protein [Corynebacterium guangdongense]MDR7329518.1 hypothetical protein [Corynebacterium guangdongense]WJZ18083.1 hypothetical protein CGUA_07605 [Corynebacterium guangdongense]
MGIPTGIALMIGATLAAVLMLLAFKTLGLVLGISLVLGTAFYISGRRPSDRQEKLRSSLRHAAGDLSDVLGLYEQFAYSEDAEHLADRTLHRPELLNPDSESPDVSAYHHMRATAERFLRRLDTHLADETLSETELENLLAITDQRSQQLQEAWWRARVAAKEIGPGH